jgi:hypothetical protein
MKQNKRAIGVEREQSLVSETNGDVGGVWNKTHIMVGSRHCIVRTVS